MPDIAEDASQSSQVQAAHTHLCSHLKPGLLQVLQGLAKDPHGRARLRNFQAVAWLVQVGTLSSRA